MEADKNLSKNLDEKKTLEIEYAHKKENVSAIFVVLFLIKFNRSLQNGKFKKTKERTEKNVDIITQQKDKGRKTLLVCNDLSRQYKTKMSELDLKQTEINGLQSDFEQKLRRKEEEETRLKKELAEIAIALNMEAVKAKNDLYDFKKFIENNKQQQIKADLSSDFELEENKTYFSFYLFFF